MKVNRYVVFSADGSGPMPYDKAQRPPDGRAVKHLEMTPFHAKMNLFAKVTSSISPAILSVKNVVFSGRSITRDKIDLIK